MAILKDNIKAYRNKLGLSQGQLAEKLGISHGAVAAWENGRNTPNPNTLERLADIFNTDVNTLLGFIPETISQREYTLKKVMREQGVNDMTPTEYEEWLSTAATIARGILDKRKDK